MRSSSYAKSLRLAVPLAALLASACAPLPDAGPRPLPRGPGTIAAGRSLPGSAGAVWPGDLWWRSLGDPQLDALIGEGLRNSPDVAAAAARFRRAAGMVSEARGATLPALDVNGTVIERKQSLNQGFPDQFREFLPKGWHDLGEINGSLTFDLDLWGRNRAALAAATSEQRAAAIDARQARLVLATGIASAYVDLDRLYEQRDVRQGELDVRLANRKLVAQRQANGLENRGSVRQADAEVGTARAALGAVDNQIGLRRNQLAALIGAGPDRGIAIARPTLPVPPVQALPEGVTTDLVGRRPDIAAARERVEAAASRIKVARADFFPAIRLTALFGVQSLGIATLFQNDSTYGSAGPAVSLPIFHGGQLQGRYRGARATYDEAVADYDRTVIGAYHDVADAVTGQRSVAQQLVDARVALAASQDAYAVARARYEGGLSSYLDVLVVQDRLLQARLAVAGLDADLRSLDIALIRALGGGFDAAGPIPKDDTHG
ncbi:MAG: efflux transporter outer membrane subunit [Novosphingobium sp.]|jgi:NodT family efflux transporter outer membrane factor (OMF) lipoprotein|nr:efflux transporter outer membrane subunit [Novosphingobium sp.]